jgi:hypothetical protein
VVVVVVARVFLNDRARSSGSGPSPGAFGAGLSRDGRGSDERLPLFTRAGLPPIPSLSRPGRGRREAPGEGEGADEVGGVWEGEGPSRNPRRGSGTVGTARR